MEFYQNAPGLSSDAAMFMQNFENLLRGKAFVEIVMVKAIDGETVDVLPLVTQRDMTGAPIENSLVYGAQVWRLQRGASAVIMDPVVGDIGVAVYCDRDSDNARANKVMGAPTTGRTHSKTDGIYFGGVLNQTPTQYVEFADNQINVVAPIKVVVDSPIAHFTGNITAEGNITDNSGTQSASVKTLRDAYNAHNHPVSGVQSGGDTVTSNVPDKQV